jgi:S-adenosylmethionine hydrolase
MQLQTRALSEIAWKLFLVRRFTCSDMRIVTLLSDFGNRDQYVSEMKGSILSLCPSTTLVDISHEIDKFNIRMGAFVLATASAYFPTDTIHVAVVDPGVGGQRRGLLIESQRALYIGPDNGILLPAALRDGIKEIHSIENQQFMRDPVSSTFHGRDVFAYAAGKIACGAEASEIGPRVSDPITVTLVGAESSPYEISCEVLAIDSFGNIATTATEKDLEAAGLRVGKGLLMRTKGRKFHLTVGRTYSDTAEGKPILLVGSYGLLELAINKANAAKRFRLSIGDRIIFRGWLDCR